MLLILTFKHTHCHKRLLLLGFIQVLMLEVLDKLTESPVARVIINSSTTAVALLNAREHVRSRK